MALSVNTNVGALNALASASATNKSLETSMARLSSGKRINSASDDAAGMAIASRLTSEIKGTNQAIRNSLDGQSLINTAEGAHQEIGNILQRMRELAVQSSNDTNSVSDRSNIQSEVEQLRTEIDRIAGTTTWAGVNLLDGATPDVANLAANHTDKKTISINAGSGTSSIDTINIEIGAVSAAALGVGGSTSRPTIGNVTNSAATLAAAYSTTTGKLTLSTNGTVANGNTVSLNINGTSHTMTISNTDSYADSLAGAASQLKAEIDALNLSGVSVTADATGVTFNAGAASAAPVVTSTVTASGASGTIVDSSNTTTFGGDFNHGDTYSMTFNGVTKSITASNADAFEDSSAGIAAQMKDAFDTAITAANTARVTGAVSGLTADELRLTGTTVSQTGSALAFAQETNVLATQLSAVGSVGAATYTVSSNTIVVGGTNAATDAVTVKINGESVTSTNSTSTGYSADATGNAALLAYNISNNADLRAAGYAATSSAGTVTITRTTAAVTAETTSATGGAATLSEGTGANAGIFTVGGNIDSGDVFNLVIDDRAVTATIATTDGFADTTQGAAQQITQAIKDANIQGVEATYNSGTATFTLTKTGSLDMTSSAAAKLSIEFIDQALEKVSAQRAKLGAVSNRLDSTVANLTNVATNLEAGRGRIEDADFANESGSLAKFQILSQAATAMLAQANASKQGVLQLLQR